MGRAKKAVVSNASAWDTEKLLPAEVRSSFDWEKDRADFDYCPSFMHLHAGIDASKLPKVPELHHIWVGDWSKGITSPQNCVLVSIPSVIDPSLAPSGKHVIHAYTPGNEPYERSRPPTDRPSPLPKQRWKTCCARGTQHFPGLDCPPWRPRGCWRRTRSRL